MKHARTHRVALAAVVALSCVAGARAYWGPDGQQEQYLSDLKERMHRVAQAAARPAKAPAAAATATQEDVIGKSLAALLKTSGRVAKLRNADLSRLARDMREDNFIFTYAPDGSVILQETGRPFYKGRRILVVFAPSDGDAPQFLVAEVPSRGTRLLYQPQLGGGFERAIVTLGHVREALSLLLEERDAQALRRLGYP